MWLTEISLNQKGRRLPFDSHYMHRILSAATDSTGYLWAHPRPGVVIVQSAAPLRRDMLRREVERISAKHMDRRLQEGQKLRIAGIVSPTRSVCAPGQRGRRGPRPLDEVPQWLTRRFAGAATLSQIQAQDLSPSKGVKPDGRRIIHQRCSVSALATVGCPDQLATILDQGLGRGKRFGCGLILAGEVS